MNQLTGLILHLTICIKTENHPYSKTNILLTINERLDRVEIIILARDITILPFIESPLQKEAGVIAGAVALRIHQLLVVVLQREVALTTTAGGSGSGGWVGVVGVGEEEAVDGGHAQTGAHAGETGEGAGMETNLQSISV